MTTKTRYNFNMLDGWYALGAGIARLKGHVVVKPNGEVEGTKSIEEAQQALTEAAEQYKRCETEFFLGDYVKHYDGTPALVCCEHPSADGYYTVKFDGEMRLKNVHGAYLERLDDNAVYAIKKDGGLA